MTLNEKFAESSLRRQLNWIDAAAIAYISVSYLSELVPVFSGYETWIAVIAVVFVAVLNIAGVRSGPYSQRIITALKIICLALLCLAALLGGRAEDSVSKPPADFTMNLSTALAALITVLWTYDGWGDINMIAGELKDPSRDLSRAVWVGCSVLIIIYLLVQFSVSSLLFFNQASTSECVFADAVSAGFSGSAAKLVAGATVLSTLGAVNGTVLVGSRLIQTMAADGFFFSVLGQLDRRGVPLHAVVMIAVTTAIYGITVSFDFLLGLFSFSVWIFYVVTAITLLILRRRRIGEPLCFHAPLGVVPPAIVIVTALVMTTGTVIESPLRALAGAGMLVLVTFAYFMWCRLLSNLNEDNLTVDGLHFSLSFRPSGGIWLRLSQNSCS